MCVCLQCRRVLKYSYAYGYYMKEGPEKRLFEHLQEHLEKNTEHLAELSEMPLLKINRTEVVNFSRVTQKARAPWPLFVSLYCWRLVFASRLTCITGHDVGAIVASLCSCHCSSWHSCWRGLRTV